MIKLHQNNYFIIFGDCSFYLNAFNEISDYYSFQIFHLFSVDHDSRILRFYHTFFYPVLELLKHQGFNH